MLRKPRARRATLALAGLTIAALAMTGTPTQAHNPHRSVKACAAQRPDGSPAIADCEGWELTTVPDMLTLGKAVSKGQAIDDGLTTTLIVDTSAVDTAPAGTAVYRAQSPPATGALGFGFGAAEGHANARLIQEFYVAGAGTYDISAILNVASFTSSELDPVPQVPLVRTAQHTLFAQTVAQFSPCGHDDTCGVSEAPDTLGSAEAAIVATGLLNLDTTVVTDGPGKIRVETGIWAASVVRGPGTAAAAATATLAPVTCTGTGACTV